MKYGLLITGGIVMLLVAILGISLLGYALHTVKDDEVGIMLRSNRIVDIVGPGVYTDLTPFADIVDVSTAALRFCAEDPEVLTQDKQRIGVKVCGDVLRPGIGGADTYRTKWAQYKPYYLYDESLVGVVTGEQKDASGKMDDITLQAIKVCVGDRSFNDTAVGSARDVLRECADAEINKLASEYGLRVANVTVPNISIHPTVQDLMDQITEKKFQTNLAIQDKEKVKADAEADLAKEQGRIKVEQGIVQEQRRQDAVTADLERLAIEAQESVIEARRSNELLDAELGLSVAEAELMVAIERAKIGLADEEQMALIYQNYPAYTEYEINRAFADAWGSSDKIIVPEGTAPQTVVNPDDTQVVIPAGQ